MLDSKDLELLQSMMTEIVGNSEARMVSRIDASIAESETRMVSRIDASIAESEARTISKVEERIEDTRSIMMAYFESAIEPKFNLLAEGHKTLLETLAPKTRVEKLEEEVSTLRSMVMALGVEVAELKKAQ